MRMELQILEALKWLKRMATNEDAALLHIAFHKATHVAPE